MVNYIIYPDMASATDLLNQINTCMGYPTDGTDCWMTEPDWMCEFNLTTGDKTSIGYGILIKEQIKDCLTAQQITEIFELPSNINVCSWSPV